jgi:glycosyltransferase involved in cell wall biosynthesis
MTFPIKILHTLRQGHIGGGETHVEELVKRLDKKQFESFVLTFSEGDMHGKLFGLGITSYIIPTSRPFDLRIKKHVRKLAEKIQPALIHAHGARACSNSYYLARQLNVPLVYTVHGWTFRDNMNVLPRFIRKLSESFLAKRANLVINVSYSDFLTGKRSLNLKNSIEIVNGVDAQIFHGKEDYSQKIKLGFRQDDFVVCMIARLTEQKDPITFIRALDHIKSEERIKAIIVGDGELLMDLKVLAHKLHLDERIIFTGPRNDIPQILSWTDVYCLPSLWEGMPIGILEAMASGCAVVATGVMGTKEIVNEENGILFSPGDYKALAQGIILLYENPEYKQYLETNARDHIQKYFSVNRMVKRVAGQYLNLLSVNQTKH